MNDSRYSSFETEEEKKAFESDRYRMASLIRDDMLWIATEVQTLEEQIDWARGHSQRTSLAESAAFQRATVNWRESDKLDLVLDITRIVSLGLLSPEAAPGARDSTAPSLREVLLDLRHHESLSVRIEPLPGENRLSLTVELTRPAGGSWRHD